MPRICAGIVTYNPDIELLVKNINSIINQVECVLVVDNGSKDIKDLKSNIKDNRVLLIENSNNLGVAKALNQLCESALENNYEWIVTLDQDSICPPDLVNKLTEFIDDKVAIVAPNIVYKNNESFSDNKIKGIQEVEWVITSASLTNLEIWKLLGGFDEKLFIDGVDRDYGIRATRSGFKVLKCFNVQLLHELGNLRCRKVCRRTIYVTNHSPLRKYYMVRNSIYLDKKHGEKRRFSYIAKNMLKTLVYEDQKISKVKSICKGIRDGYRM